MHRARLRKAYRLVNALMPVLKGNGISLSQLRDNQDAFDWAAKLADVNPPSAGTQALVLEMLEERMNGGEVVEMPAR